MKTKRPLKLRRVQRLTKKKKVELTPIVGRYIVSNGKLYRSK